MLVCTVEWYWCPMLDSTGVWQYTCNFRLTAKLLQQWTWNCLANVKLSYSTCLMIVTDHLSGSKVARSAAHELLASSAIPNIYT